MGQPVFLLREILPPEEFALWCAYLDLKWFERDKWEWYFAALRSDIAAAVGSKRPIDRCLLPFSTERPCTDEDSIKRYVELAKARWKRATGK